LNYYYSSDAGKSRFYLWTSFGDLFDADESMFKSDGVHFSEKSLKIGFDVSKTKSGQNVAKNNRIFIRMLKLNKNQNGEKSPNLVTLDENVVCMYECICTYVHICQLFIASRDTFLTFTYIPISLK
jgi:hypothetical protein